MQNKFYKHIAKVTAVATVLSTVMSVMPARAALITSASSVMTRVKISTNADHTITFTLPSTITFDSSTNTDFLRVDFPHSSGFTQTGTWVAGDFTFNDGTARTINAVEQGAGDVDCTVAAGVDNVCISVDTTNHIFTIKPSSTYTASAAAATVIFTIDGTTTPAGELINPSSAGSYSVLVAQCDEAASCDTAFANTHSNTLAVGITADDQVNVTATVDPSLTFDIDTATTDTESAAPYTVALGTITTADSRVSGATDSVNFIWLDLSTNASGGAVITVRNANGALGLRSTSVPADDIASATGTIANGTENYGICVVSATSSSGATPAAVAPFASTCTADLQTPSVGVLPSTASNIITAGSPVSGLRGRIAVAAAISGVTPAHADYTDTLTFIATGTF